MKSKIIRAFLLTLMVAAVTAVGFFAYSMTENREWLEAAVASSILFGVLVLADICFAVVSVKEWKRREKKHGETKKDGEKRDKK